MFSDLVAGGINRVFHPGQSQPATGSSTLTPAISPSFAQASIVRRTKLEIEATCENGDTLTKSFDLPAPVPPTLATLPRCRLTDRPGPAGGTRDANLPV